MPEGGLPPIVLNNKGGNKPPQDPRGPPVPPSHPAPRGPVMNQGMPLNRPQGMPPHGMPPQGMPPQGMPPQGMAPQFIPPQNHPNMQMSLQRFPHPPPHALPHDLRPHGSPAGIPIGISDLRSERFTEADARERLSTYVMIRLEKMENPYDVDEEGYPLKPTWERIRRIPLTDISQQEAKRQVRVLERDTKPVSEKKEACSLAVQRQLERAQEELAKLEEDKRFCYHLVQFESKLKAIDYKDIQYYDRQSKKDKKDKRDKKEKKYVSSSKKTKKPKYERVSITAYFKRTPTQEQDPFRMIQEKEKAKQMMLVPQIPGPIQPFILPQPQPQGFQPPPGVMPQQPLKMLENPPIQVKPGDKDKEKGKKNDKEKDKKGKKIVAVVKTRRRRSKHSRSSPSSSRRSSSDNIWDSDGSESSTSESSLETGSGHSKHRRGRSRTRAHRNTPENYGLSGALRVHTKDERAYIVDPSMARFVNPPPVPLPSPQGYSSGERPFGRESYPAFHEEYSYKPRKAPSPRIFQNRNGVRHVPEKDARVEVLQDELERTESRIHRMRLNAAYREEDPALDEARLDRLDEDLQHRKFLKDQLQDQLKERPWRKTDAANYMDNKRRSRNA